jgi:4a-hydroxytetrahydrobiopterin dehydratase
MSEASPEVLSESEVQGSLDGWRVLLNQAHATFLTRSFVKGVEFISRITELAEAANHHPDVDLRYRLVHVAITTHEGGPGWRLSARDVELAQQISALATEMEIDTDLNAPQSTEIAIDALDIPAVLPFWREAFGYVDAGRSDIIDPVGIGPSVWFQQMDAPRHDQRNRIHIDITVPHDVAEQRVAAAVEAGGRLVSDESAPAFWILADPEGNEACICTWQGRD